MNRGLLLFSLPFILGFWPEATRSALAPRFEANSPDYLQHDVDIESSRVVPPTTWLPQPGVGLSINRQVTFADPEYGWIISDNSWLLRTTDGGNTWQSEKMSWTGHTGICFVDRYRGWVTTATVSNGGRIRATTDGGKTWIVQQTDADPSHGYRGVTFVNADVGWVWRDDGTLLRTTNGGSTWEQFGQGHPVITHLFFLDTNNGWAAAGGDTVYRTTDGGASWTGVDPGLGSGCSHLMFHDAKRGWVTGSGSEIARTTDGGQTWSVCPTGADPPSMNSIDFADSMNGWLCGTSGRILHTSDGGTSWYKEDSGTSEDLTSVSARKTISPVIVGSGGSILRQPYVHVQSPIGNEVWRIGTARSIRWSAWGIDEAEVSLSVDSGSTWLSMGVFSAGTSSMSFTVPHRPSRTCFVRVVPLADESIADRSDAPFTITAAGPITECEPNDAATLATTIVLGDTIKGSVESLQDRDYFAYTGVAGDTIEVTIDDTSNGDELMTLILFNSGGWIIERAYNHVEVWWGLAGDTPSHGRVQLTYIVPSSAQYYLRYSFASAGTTFQSVDSCHTDSHGGIDGGVPKALPADGSKGQADAQVDYTLVFQRRIPVPPRISNSWVTASRYDAVRFYGTVEPLGSPTTVAFDFGIGDSDGTTVDAIPATVDGYAGSFQVASPLGLNLNPDTTYSMRLRAANRAGTTYGERIRFRSPTIPEGWAIQPTPSTGNLTCVAFADPRRGIAVGGSSSFLYTTNGGEEWTSQTIGAHASWHGVSYPSPNVAILVGSGGNILRTTDAGSTWTASIYPPGSTLNAVTFPSPQLGFAVGPKGTIIRTTDGGLGWTRMDSRSIATLSDVTFVGEHCGWVIGEEWSSSTFLNTTDSGLSWYPNFYTARVRAISFGDVKTGFAVGDKGTLKRTVDGGMSWYDVYHQFGSYDFSDVWCFDSLQACIIGSEGLILMTADGGRTFRRQGSGTTIPLNDLWFVNPAYGTIVGDQGYVLHTTSPALRWSAMLTLSDRIGRWAWLIFGQARQATDGRDLTLGEYPVSQTLSTARLGARFLLPSDGAGTSLTDLRNDALSSIEWTISLQCPTCDYPMTLTWDFRELPRGSFTLSDGPSRRLASVDMKQHQTLAITDSSIKTLRIVSVISGEPLSSEAEVPEEHSLAQNYPNPFNPSTRIQYGLPAKSWVVLAVFNVLGQRMTTLVEGEKDPGYYEVEFDASGLPSGTYFYRLQTEYFAETRKLVVLR